MMKNRIISTLLAVLMLLGAFSFVISAEGEVDVFEPEYNTKSSKPTINYLTGQMIPDDAQSAVIEFPEQKIETMDLRYEKDGYQLYVDAYSGEIAVKNIASGEILFSNPYDLGSTKATDEIKSELLSQIKVNFTDIITDMSQTYDSYEWAASRGQIRVKNIKNGIRVEYTIGREQAKMLVPECIEKSSFETKLMTVIEESMKSDGDYSRQEQHTFNKFVDFYVLKDTSNMLESLIPETHKLFPVTKKMAIYVLDPATTTNEKARLEQTIKTYAPSYTYEDLDADHLLTEYENKDENPPLFKLALEYTLDEQGLVVRLPANGIRFAESLYRLDSIEILPYMGAGSNPNTGYTFFPDGSGTLFDFEQTAALGSATNVTGKVYGVDYAYHNITGTHQETIRYPVFGVYENQGITTMETTTEFDEEGNPVTVTKPNTTYKERGFVAIVEEGDAMMELTVDHAVRAHKYNTVKMSVYPRPQDTYNVADAISVGQNDTWTVVSSRKYTGNYKVRYIMLTSEEVAEEKQLTGTYDTSYVGMAKAYREYLVKNGVLSKLKAEDVKSNIPLYIETFGAMETTERFLSIPFDVMTPLTTFADINTMYDELAAKGIDNINFIMTGYTKGGLTNPTVPYKLKWENAVEDGGMDFEDLTEQAREKGFQLFPDLDFAFSSNNTLTDGLNLKKHAVKTIDDRYTSKREYSATKQTYISYYELALSPAYFSHFYEKFTESYLKYDPIGISVSTLGSYLNSDFDEKDPYNRSDAKDFTERAFQYIRENYGKVMTAGGNAFTWKYVDYITDIALDSSRYSQSAAAVPFLGIVLHGYVEYAGTAINMEGNIEYTMLKALENGAALKFILSYRNTDNLKDYELLSQYYSVRYDIWLDDLVSLYTELNGVLKDLQTSTIEKHMFLEGTRIPDSDELEKDLADAIADAIEAEKALSEAQKEELRQKLHDTRKTILERIPDINKAIAAPDPADKVTTVTENIELMHRALNDLKLSIIPKAQLEAAVTAAETALKEKMEALDEAYVDLTTAMLAGTNEELKALAQASDIARTALNEAEQDYKDASAALEADPDNETLKEALAQAEEALNEASEVYAEAYAKVLEAIEADPTSSDANVQAAIDAYMAVVEEYVTVLETYNDAVANYNRKQELANPENYINRVYNLADASIKEVRTLIKNYEDAVEGLELIKSENAFTANIRSELTDILADNKAAYEQIKGNVAGIEALEVTITKIAKEAFVIYDAAPKTPSGSEGEGEQEESVEFKDYEYVEEVKEEVKDDEDASDKAYNKYTSDANKIVYMEYVSENGSVTAFLLNFNNYAVTVTAPNGVNYTIEAYGYIVLKPTANA